VDTIEYSPFGNQGVILKFPCKTCGHFIESDEIGIPTPDFSAETARDSYSDNEDQIVCPNCDEEYTVTVWASFAGGYIEIEGLRNLSNVEIETVPEPYDDYYEEVFSAITDSRRFLSNFKTEIQNLAKLNSTDLGDHRLNTILKRQIFIGAVTAVETFLSDTFINLTLNNPEYLKNFVETNPEFRKRTIQIKDIYSVQQNLNNVAKSVMLEMIYHHLPKIKEMYEATFKIEFPNLKFLIIDVATRHDLVHRSGKTKDGVVINITEADNERVLTNAEVFVSDIAYKLKLKNEDVDRDNPEPDLPF
jgi:hypothetical protein